MTGRATPVTTAAYGLAEGPRYDAANGELLWVDIEAGRLLRAAPHDLDAVTEARLDVPLGAVAPRAGGGWVLAAGRGFSLMAADGEVTPLAEVEPAGNRMNDGACDPQGRFWAGSMEFEARPGAASLYRLDTDGTVSVVLRDLTISNGLGWSPDGTTMYLADTGPGTVTAYDFDGATGAIERPRVVVEAEGADGLTVDDDGLLWIARFGHGVVARYDPADGRELVRIELPASQPTSCAFVGSTLIITTAARDVGDAEPEAGRLFAADAGVTGPPAIPYAG